MMHRVPPKNNTFLIKYGSPSFILPHCKPELLYSRRSFLCASGWGAFYSKWLHAFLGYAPLFQLQPWPRLTVLNFLPFAPLAPDFPHLPFVRCVCRAHLPEHEREQPGLGGWQAGAWWSINQLKKTGPIVAAGASCAAQMPGRNCISQMTGPGPLLQKLMESSRVAWVTLPDLCCHRGLCSVP